MKEKAITNPVESLVATLDEARTAYQQAKKALFSEIWINQ
jgi:hypothetical protein